MLESCRQNETEQVVCTNKTFLISCWLCIFIPLRNLFCITSKLNTNRETAFFFLQTSQKHDTSRSNEFRELSGDNYLQRQCVPVFVGFPATQGLLESLFVLWGKSNRKLQTVGKATPEATGKRNET